MKEKERMRREIEAQTRAFLEGGGTIKKIPTGQGTLSKRPVHMTREQWVEYKKKSRFK